MSIFRKTTVFAALAAVIMAAPAAQAQNQTIGALFPLSGPNASYGDVFSAGANLAVEHINADQMLGGTLTIQYEDSQGLPQQGVIAMNKLVNVTKVPYVLSAFTGVSKAVSATATRSKTVTVNGGGVGPDLAELGTYFWNVIPLANVEVKAILPFLANERKLKNLVLVYVDDPLGQSIQKEIEKALPAVGGKLLESLSVPPSAQQFSGIAARIRAANPDAVYIASFGAQQTQIIKQLRDNGLQQQFVSYSAFSVPETSRLPEALGALYTAQSVDWSSSDPVTRRFADDYQRKHHKAPTAYVANYYNAVRLFGLLAQQLRQQGRPVTGESLLAQRLQTKTFDLVGGRVTFGDDGTVISPMQVVEIDGKAGKIVASGLR
ncbi:ABC transporter substrate-binding protein [Variovorax sp. J22P271]|uniref:ABC transporter substrate-binding protein n=1 Tax=Variovorax davisae TaxID=3053515 RepID=UPI002578F7C0|nr:ABC transporter substrate-binding protein [Variovorax sp. J22P271]MDM0034338.1 ABC transporter substrate-binding protein [Variovorax sp. J22P271]